MTKTELKNKALKHIRPGGVVYATSDGCIFLDIFYAKKRADKYGLDLFEFKKQPIKKIKNGTK